MQIWVLLNVLLNIARPPTFTEHEANAFLLQPTLQGTLVLHLPCSHQLRHIESVIHPGHVNGIHVVVLIFIIITSKHLLFLLLHLLS